jgi:hypothetical protein
MMTGVKICERVEVSTIKYQLSRQPKMKCLLFTSNFSFKCVLPYFSCPSNMGFARLDPGIWEMVNRLWPAYKSLSVRQ